MYLFFNFIGEILIDNFYYRTVAPLVIFVTPHAQSIRFTVSPSFFYSYKYFFVC
nr:MAG TPA: hypothetical protein [Caudoviricetes sp.]